VLYIKSVMDDQGLQDSHNTDVAVLSMSLVGLFIALLVNLSCFACCRSTSQLFSSVRLYKEFLLNFNETPRSRLVKKYHPPMEVLLEETSTMEHSRLSTPKRIGGSINSSPSDEGSLLEKAGKQVDLQPSEILEAHEWEESSLTTTSRKLI